MYTHRPHGVNYCGYLRVLIYLLFFIIVIKEKGLIQMIGLQTSNWRHFHETIVVKSSACLLICITRFSFSIIIIIIINI